MNKKIIVANSIFFISAFMLAMKFGADNAIVVNISIALLMCINTVTVVANYLIFFAMLALIANIPYYIYKKYKK